MRAWEVARPGPIESGPLEFVERPVPEPGPGEVLVRVSACGVCRTDLHVAEGDLPPHRPRVIPGHEVVGVVERRGEGAVRFAPGERIGIAWLRWTCGRCRFCSRGDENLCLETRFTGWDEDGGYAEYAVVPEGFAYRVPEAFDDQHAAPLLCAGIIGYRALRQSSLPPGGSLGIWGFGGSAHLAAQVAIHEGARVHVFTRSEPSRRLAAGLGAASVQDVDAPSPEPLDAAILFAPSGGLVLVALEALDRGATLAIAGIHLTTIPALDYRDLFYERKVTSVTASTRRDGEEFLRMAAEIPVAVTTAGFGLDEAATALAALRRGEITGAAVLLP